MRDYNNANIVRLLHNGRRVGAVVQIPGHPDMVLSESGLSEFSSHLKRTGQKLGNATITVDGRIVPRGSRVVRDDDGMKYIKELTARRYRPQTQPQPQIRSRTQQSEQLPYQQVQQSYAQPALGSAAQSNPYKPSPELYGRFGIPEGPTEDRLLSSILSGLELARRCGVHYQLNYIKQNPERRSRRRYYLRVDVTSNSLEHKYREIYFSAYPDGTIEVDGQWKDADILSYVYQGDKVYCQNAVDVKNAMIWLLHKSGWSSEYNKNKEDIDKLAAESENRQNTIGKDIAQELVLPHSSIDGGFQENVRDFEQIKRFLNDKFAGTYVFSWAMSADKAVLHARKYTKDFSALSDPLLSIAYQLFSVGEGKSVRMSYKSKPSYNTLGSGRWVALREFQCLRYLDQIGDAAQSVLSSVFSPGAFREAYDVVAWGKDNGVMSYLIRGKSDPVSEQELLDLAEGGTIVNGVQFELGADGALIVTNRGVDRYGHDLAQFAKAKDGKYYMRVMFSFTDTVADIDTQLKAAVPWELYLGLATATRTPSSELRHPSLYSYEMLLNAQAQRQVLSSLGSALVTICKERGYNETKKAQLVLDFMKCFWFVHLSDTTHGNKTPVETLVDKAGCCIEQSLLGAILTTLIGINSCILYRYSPALNTRFHAVVGVRLHDFDDGEALDFCGSSEDSKYTYVAVGGFLGLEVSGIGGIPVGAVKYWDEDNTGATNMLGRLDTSKLSQVICVPFYTDFTCGQAFAQYAPDRSPISQITPLTREQWREILRWFA